MVMAFAFQLVEPLVYWLVPWSAVKSVYRSASRLQLLLESSSASSSEMTSAVRSVVASAYESGEVWALALGMMLVTVSVAMWAGQLVKWSARLLVRALGWWWALPLEHRLDYVLAFP